ncbi:MAG: carboxy terminal-processing peptidase [Bacteroidetes bacterium]|nr:carboxy terminal-processing peptidase [Bacteroidota bacterium]
MKKIVYLLIIILAQTSFAQDIERLQEENSVLDTNKFISPDLHHPKVAKVVTTILSRYHYNKTQVNDSLSSIIFDNYLKALDYNRLYFYKSDISLFENFRDNFDNFLLLGRLDVPFEIFNTFKERLNERMKYVAKLLKTEFNYSIDEEFVPDRKEAEWAGNESELDDIWRKRLKSDALNKRLAKEDWEKISSTLLKRYQNYHKIILQYKPEDVFQLFLNSFSSAIDPHSNYFSPIASDNFNIAMSLSLEGIGAQLSSIDDYTTIVHIIPGGPAAKSGKLFENDRIVSVGQGSEGEMIDVVGWRIDDVVQLIRGKKGTVVRLAILKANATYDSPLEHMELVRDKIKLEEQAAKSDIIFVEEEGVNYKLGVIDIPTFYIDFEAKRKNDPDYKSTTKDVHKLIEQLVEEKVDGIILDLRNNGGGALQEAIELTGLFIKDGPVVQVRNSNGSIDVGTDPDGEIVYSGPLAVLTNRYSASASEIFSGAIQDYGRGLIIGEQTFGKGTVQNLIDLNRQLPISKDKMGDLKLTVAKYYRITGSSTQKLGVQPDISYPSPIDSDEFGEAAQPAALSWDQIGSTKFEKYDTLQKYMPELISKHNARIAEDLDFQFLNEDIEEYKESKSKKSYSLNEEVRRIEREERENKKKQREEERQNKSKLKIVEKSEVNTEEEKEDDPLLNETGKILSDFIALKFG